MTHSKPTRSDLIRAQQERNRRAVEERCMMALELAKRRIMPVYHRYCKLMEVAKGFRDAK